MSHVQPIKNQTPKIITSKPCHVDMGPNHGTLDVTPEYPEPSCSPQNMAPPDAPCHAPSRHAQPRSRSDRGSGGPGGSGSRARGWRGRQRWQHSGCQGETKAMTATGEAKKTLQLMDLSQVGVWDGQFTRHGVLKQLMMIEKPRWIKNQGARPCPNQVLGKVLGNGTGMQEENQCIYIYI